MTPLMAVLLSCGLLDSPALGEATDPDALFAPEETPACSIPAPAPLPDWLQASPPEPAPERTDPRAAGAAGTPSLALVVESRLGREAVEAWARPSAALEPVSVAPPTRRTPARRGRFGLQFSGRAWPFAVAAAADVASTHWGLGRGGSEKNPFLASGRMDLGMVKIVQFPLLFVAVEALQSTHPRWARQLRWLILAFHGALAVNNVRVGRSIDRGLGPRAPRP